jgi:hypothetical protein
VWNHDWNHHWNHQKYKNNTFHTVKGGTKGGTKYGTKAYVHGVFTENIPYKMENFAYHALGTF